MNFIISLEKLQCLCNSMSDLYKTGPDDWNISQVQIHDCGQSINLETRSASSRDCVCPPAILLF